MRPNEIITKINLAEGIKLFEVNTSQIAAKAKPGQFVIIRIDEKGERVPLTIADSNSLTGTITLIFQEIGKSTRQLGTLEKGDSILDVVGPLGHPTHIENVGRVVCIGGGIGAAPLYPIIKGLKSTGNTVISIIGARNKKMLIMEDEIRSISNELYITTDDGSYGDHGFVTDTLKHLIAEGNEIKHVFAIGPVVMMRAVSLITQAHNIPTTVSLNAIMVDGTGMCGCCRVMVGGKRRFSCVDGPEFKGDEVDFDDLINRQQTYLVEEKCSLEKYVGCQHLSEVPYRNKIGFQVF